jgi:hypothetical protein
MPRFGPIKCRDLVDTLHRLGFAGPLPGGRHEYMVRGTRKVPIPNPHAGDIDPSLLAELLRQAGISRDEWEAL